MLYYSKTARFVSDYERLSPSEQKMFLDIVFNKFIPDLNRVSRQFRSGLRVRSYRSVPRLWELARAPDGRALWKYGEMPEGRDGVHVVWLRVGDHSIYSSQ